MKFPWNKKNNKDKEKKISEVNFKNELDREEVIQNPKVENRKKNIIKNEQKFRFDNALYSFDTLPDSAKQTLSLLTKSDKLIKLYKQKVDILNFTKRSLNESLKRSLKSIEESKSIAK
jgi:hypothetical protein